MWDSPNPCSGSGWEFSGIAEGNIGDEHLQHGTVRVCAGVVVCWEVRACPNYWGGVKFSWWVLKKIPNVSQCSTLEAWIDLQNIWGNWSNAKGKKKPRSGMLQNKEMSHGSESAGIIKEFITRAIRLFHWQHTGSRKTPYANNTRVEQRGTVVGITCC